MGSKREYYVKLYSPLGSIHIDVLSYPSQAIIMYAREELGISNPILVQQGEERGKYLVNLLGYIDYVFQVEEV